MSIAERIREIRRELPPGVELVAVSKTRSPEEIMEAYNSGQQLFGENKAQELLEKAPHLPADISWHFIGHLQSNKVKMVVPLVDMIHSVDSLKLLKAIDREAGKSGRVVSCLLEFRIAEEESKFGLTFEEGMELLASEEFRQLRNVEIAGVMGMAAFSDDDVLIRKEFKTLFTIFGRLKELFFVDYPHFREISMGMSSDYKIAVEEGSTLIRLGFTIFGERSYH